MYEKNIVQIGFIVYTVKLRFQASTGAVERMPTGEGHYCTMFVEEGGGGRGRTPVQAVRHYSGCKLLSSSSSLNTQG